MRGQRLLNALPLGLFEWMVPRDAVGFVYHLVSESPLPHVRHLYAHKTPEEFEADLDYLLGIYEFTDWHDLLSVRSGTQRQRRPLAVLTFDDGLAQCFDLIRPILLRRGVTATFFISTRYIDNREMFYRHKASLCIDRIETAASSLRQHLLRSIGQNLGIAEFSHWGLVTWLNRLEIVDEAMLNQVCHWLEIDVDAELRATSPYMTTNQLRLLAADGFTLGGHSLTHARLQLLGRGAIEQELVASCDFIRGLVGAANVPFAFPFNGTNIDRDLINSILQRHPWIRVVSDSQGLLKDRSFVIQRIASDTPDRSTPRRSNLGPLIRRSYMNELRRRKTAA